MKKPKFYIEKIMNCFTHWKDYLPITNMALFGTVVILAGIIIALFFLPILLLKPGKLDEETLVGVDKALLISQKLAPTNVNEFDSIGKNNIFRSSRTDWKVSKPSVTPPKKKENKIVKKKKKTAKPKVKPEKIKLSAIVVFGDIKVALIENLDKSKDKDKFIYVKEGEDVAGYTVKSIERDKLVVEWNGEESIIMLYKL